VDGVYWTLWIEVRFYVMAAILFFLVRRRFLTALTAVTLVSFIAGVRAFHYPHRDWAWTLLLPTFLPYFTFGVAVYRLSQTRRLALEAGVAAGLCILIIVIQGWVSFDYPAGEPLGFALVNAAIIAAFLLFAFGNPVLQPFGWRPLARLGQASYSLYLIHSVVGIIMIQQLSLVMPWPAAFVLASLTMIALSLALFHVVEEPGKRLILTLTGRASASARSRPRPPLLHRRVEQTLPSTISNG
jgi:peptidoglycan/LPS O-acetylase OafA/YrhL